MLSAYPFSKIGAPNVILHQVPVSVIPIEYIKDLPCYFEFMLSFEICYTIVKKMLEEDGEMITRTELLFLMTEMMKKYDEIGMDKMEEDVREFLGEEVFARYNELSLKRKDYIIEFCKKESEETLFFLKDLVFRQDILCQ